MLRIGILGSTRGTHLLSLLGAIRDKKLAAEVSVVISNKADAFILQRAQTANIAHHFIDPNGLTREVFDEKVSDVLQKYDVDMVVLIGYMRILSAGFIDHWRNKIINVHPSLLPAFAGLMDLNVHRAVIKSGIKETGCTVHVVTEDIDAGPIISQKRCPVFPHDTPETLKARVQQLEAEALVEAVQNFCRLG